MTGITSITAQDDQSYSSENAPPVVGTFSGIFLVTAKGYGFTKSRRGGNKRVWGPFVRIRTDTSDDSTDAETRIVSSSDRATLE